MGEIKEILKKLIKEELAEDDKVEMPEKDYIAEHKKLINTIKSKDPEKLDEEKEEQKAEVEDKTGVKINGNDEEDDDEDEEEDDEEEGAGEDKPGQRGLLKLAVLMMKKKKKE